MFHHPNSCAIFHNMVSEKKIEAEAREEEGYIPSLDEAIVNYYCNGDDETPIWVFELIEEKMR